MNDKQKIQEVGAALFDWATRKIEWREVVGKCIRAGLGISARRYLALIPQEPNRQKMENYAARAFKFHNYQHEQ